MATVYLGLGSNLGDRNDNIERAISLLEKNNIRITKRSVIIETEPVDSPPQNKFLNSAIEVQVTSSPQDLLSTLKSIEKELGKVKTEINGPRTIDIDILLYDNVNINTPELIIPHPRMLKREFVMMPLGEIAPEKIEELTNASHKIH